ncbi:MAG: cytochrome P450 [Myxococcota bacterium]|nr:cytochrome P450 [Myxococcota bacterium]
MIVPGPRRWPVLGNALGFMRDPTGFVARNAVEHGDVVRLDMGGVPFYQVNRPEYIHEVLVTRSRDFRKGSPGPDRGLLFGRGLATNEGDAWRRQRRLSQPAFRRDRIAAYGAVMAQVADRHVSGWPVGREVDLHPLFMRLSLEVVARVLFGADVGARGAIVGERLELLMNHFGSFSEFLYRFVPKGFPTPARRRFRRAVRDLDAIVYDLIAERRERDKDDGDLLGTLIAARDDDASEMSDEQLRDEVMTLFLAGHETTALALTWSVGLLAGHPEVDARLAAELHAVLGERPPEATDVPRLAYTRLVLKEAMRLYPPAWILVRQALCDVPLGDAVIPARAFVTVSPWVLHRSADWFDDPLTFRPERWEDGLEGRLPKCVYFPFGAGQRVCIGQEFAMTEAVLVLATLMQRLRFARDGELVIDPSLSLRPRGGMRGVLHRRGPTT